MSSFSRHRDRGAQLHGGPSEFWHSDREGSASGRHGKINKNLARGPANIILRVSTYLKIVSRDQVEEIVVGDDCSIPENERSVAGRRGLVGMLFVVKIAGALAEKGSPLREVVEIARRVSQSVATYGVGLSACAIPGTRQSGLVSYHYVCAVLSR